MIINMQTTTLFCNIQTDNINLLISSSLIWLVIQNGGNSYESRMGQNWMFSKLNVWLFEIFENL